MSETITTRLSRRTADLERDNRAEPLRAAGARQRIKGAVWNPERLGSTTDLTKMMRV